MSVIKSKGNCNVCQGTGETRSGSFMIHCFNCTGHSGVIRRVKPWNRAKISNEEYELNLKQYLKKN